MESTEAETRPRGCVLRPLLGQHRRRRTLGGSRHRRAPRVHHVGRGRRLADGADAVAAADGGPEVGDAAVALRRRRVDGRRVARHVALPPLVRLLIRRILWALEPGWPGQRSEVMGQA